MIKNGRQVSPTLDGIRADHLRRYETAVQVVRANAYKRGADVGAGTGYGSLLLARAAVVDSYEIDPSAIAFGEQHFSHPSLRRHVGDMATLEFSEPLDFMTMFEVIEHSRDAPGFLARSVSKVKTLIGSVPNEAVVHFNAALHHRHVRHYTADEISDELRKAGWTVTKLGSQRGKRGHEAFITWGNTQGRTLVFVAAGSS